MILDKAMTLQIAKALSLIEITDKLSFIKFKNFCSVKDNVKGMRRYTRDKGEKKKKHLHKTSDKGLLSKIYLKNKP